MTSADVLRIGLGLAKERPAAATILTVVAMIGWLAWGTFTDNGFARADEVQQIKRDVSSLRAETLEGQLFEARVSQCKASGELKRLYAERVSKLQLRYRSLTGTSYELPDCDEI